MENILLHPLSNFCFVAYVDSNLYEFGIPHLYLGTVILGENKLGPFLRYDN